MEGGQREKAKRKMRAKETEHGCHLSMGASLACACPHGFVSVLQGASKQVLKSVCACEQAPVRACTSNDFFFCVCVCVYERICVRI